MKTYTSVDGIKILVGENAKENDNLTTASYPNGMALWLKYHLTFILLKR